MCSKWSFWVIKIKWDVITMLDAAHLFRWSTLTFLCNHWKLWTFVSPGYEFKISVTLETWLLYSQLLYSSDGQLQTNKQISKRDVSILQKISAAIRLPFASVLDVLGCLMPSLSGLFLYFRKPRPIFLHAGPLLRGPPPPHRNPSPVYGDVWYTAKFILFLALELLFWKVSDTIDLRVF